MTEGRKATIKGISPILLLMRGKRNLQKEKVKPPPTGRGILQHLCKELNLERRVIK
jgi:hypothetical protein